MEMFGFLSFMLLVLHTSAYTPVPGLVKEIIHVEQKKSWYDATAYCLSNSGKPFMVLDKNVAKNFSSSANQLSWVGLFRNYAIWYWVDKTLSTYFNWFGKCASLNRVGFWHTKTCDDKLNYLCKRVSGDWVLVKESKTWQEAKQHCETDHAGLAIISNEGDNSIISALVETDFAWIGLARVQQNSPLKETWRWVNNEPVTYSRWFSALFCAAIDWRGFWHDRVCFEEHPFICFRHVDLILEFKLVSENKAWNEAETHCKLLNMNLVIVKTEEELTALVVYIKSIHDSFMDDLYFWMGLYNNPWYWSSSSIRTQFWKSMQPDNVDSKNKIIVPVEHACGALKDGELLDETCIDPLPFFCTATVRSMILVSEPKSWMEALKHCRDKNVNLASLSSAMEQYVAEQKVERVQTSYVWIGLNFLAGSWIWVYGDDIQYVNWVNGENLQCPVTRRCGALTVANGKWEARSCEERMEFLCFQT
ncbi:hypothetical protein QQF64_003779 [Cirrhinus molitorella]|uniref:C-type lectin domain-containing protein n=1 Tax=Cirrhinus molitorella TaxID=172907 RepID=A0ABR3MMA0_9TELE